MNEFLLSIGMGLCVLVFLILYRVVFGPID